jgi:hypothetical protein
MNKILGIVVLGLLLSSNAYAFTKGTGEVKMTEGAIRHFISYVKGESNIKREAEHQNKPKPDMFILSSNGNWTSAWFCPYARCLDSLSADTIIECERETGTTCGVFASRRTIYWDNGINTKKKKAKFKSQMSDSEIRAKLIKLGFIGDSTSTVTPKILKKKKEVKKSKSEDDVVKKLNDLKELYESGVLTEEEFKKAKKKILN